jgi:16S rRNA (cytosine1402-N4)-methyltransferase
VLFDFGVSSFHFDTPERGFSFRLDGPGQRLDPRKGRPASEYLETADPAEIGRAIRDYGEEPSAPHHRRHRTRRRHSALARSISFAELVAKAAPGPRRTHPPRHRTFQGIRIALNDELGVIERALPAAFGLLAPGGVLAVISFHRLEDRIVKRLFRRLAGLPETRHDNARSRAARSAPSCSPRSRSSPPRLSWPSTRARVPPAARPDQTRLKRRRP